MAFFADALTAGRFCLELLCELVPCRVALLHLYDAERREFIVVDAMGAGSDAALLGRVGQRDPLLSVSMPRAAPFTWSNLTNAPVHSVERLAKLGGATCIMHAPVKASGRYLGVIELIDATDGAAFDRRRENALAYVAERYAEFLSAHGVITEVAVVARHAYAD
jgi:hypothetical protein